MSGGTTRYNPSFHPTATHTLLYHHPSHPSILQPSLYLLNNNHSTYGVDYQQKLNVPMCTSVLGQVGALSVQGLQSFDSLHLQFQLCLRLYHPAGLLVGLCERRSERRSERSESGKRRRGIGGGKGWRNSQDREIRDF